MAIISGTIRIGPLFHKALNFAALTSAEPNLYRGYEDGSTLNIFVKEIAETIASTLKS
ncbi:MAG: hypothetical protein ACYCR7_01180 [Thermoplasmataceae archaeon]